MDSQIRQSVSVIRISSAKVYLWVEEDSVEALPRVRVSGCACKKVAAISVARDGGLSI